MPMIEYRPKAFGQARQQVIDQAVRIASDYGRQGFSLTLRQLYYRFVAADLIPNTIQSYKRLGDIINDARYAGLFDWSWLTDRTRNATGGDNGFTPGHPEEVIEPGVYDVTRWDDQPHRVEVWVEKDALVDVIQRAARGLNIVTFSCRGYTSSSEIWSASRRLMRHLTTPGVEHVTVLHLGDHDPSGIDMSRDIEQRLREFISHHQSWSISSKFDLRRIALTMEQIEQYDPPPNPAKETDSRFQAYRDQYGDESWELDALEPQVLVDLIRSEITPLIDHDLWRERVKIGRQGQATLQAVRDHYEDVIEHLTDMGWMPEIDDSDDLADDGDLE